MILATKTSDQTRVVCVFCCGQTYDSLTLYGTTGSVGVAWDVGSHAMSAIVVERVTAWELRATKMLNGYPKGLSVKFYEDNDASLITECLTRPVMWMVP